MEKECTTNRQNILKCRISHLGIKLTAFNRGLDFFYPLSTLSGFTQEEEVQMLRRFRLLEQSIGVLRKRVRHRACDRCPYKQR